MLFPQLLRDGEHLVACVLDRGLVYLRLRGGIGCVSSGVTGTGTGDASNARHSAAATSMTARVKTGAETSAPQSSTGPRLGDAASPLLNEESYPVGLGSQGIRTQV